MIDAKFCEHANEIPMQCPCTEDCYCKTHSCRFDRFQPPQTDALSTAIARFEATLLGMSVEENVQIIEWLKELQLFRKQDQNKNETTILNLYTTSYGLTADEAKLAYATYGFKLPSLEKGTCRHCKGRGRVEVPGRSCIIGKSTEDCSVCRSTGIDEQRVKLPAKV